MPEFSLGMPSLNRFSIAGILCFSYLSLKKRLFQFKNMYYIQWHLLFVWDVKNKQKNLVNTSSKQFLHFKVH